MSSRKRKLQINKDEDTNQPPLKKHIASQSTTDNAKASELESKINYDALAAMQSTINPLTNQTYSAHYFDLLHSRKKLPIWLQRREFIQTFQQNRVTVLVGETGSGKTTSSMSAQHFPNLSAISLEKSDLANQS